MQKMINEFIESVKHFSQPGSLMETRSVAESVLSGVLFTSITALSIILASTIVAPVSFAGVVATAALAAAYNIVGAPAHMGLVAKIAMSVGGYFLKTPAFAPEKANAFVIDMAAISLVLGATPKGARWIAAQAEKIFSSTQQTAEEPAVLSSGETSALGNKALPFNRTVQPSAQTTVQVTPDAPKASM